MSDKLRYNPDHPVSYFLYECPYCGSQFYGGGPALHNPGCEAGGYKNCICIFGPKQVERVKKHGEWWGLSISMLREHFPELLTS